MDTELTTKEKESLLTRAASLIVKSEKKRKKISFMLEGFLWGFILGVGIMILATVKP